MIQDYQFNNADPNGDKQAVILPNLPSLINKLSADETNGIKDKLNELVESANSGGGGATVGVTQIINVGSIGNVPIQDVVNLDDGYVIQGQELGIRLVTSNDNGVAKNYLFLAPGGTYGINLLQTVAADFEAFGESNQNPNSFKQNKIYKTTLSLLGVDTFELLTPLIIKNWIESLNIVDEDNFIYYYEITDEIPNFDVTANWETGDSDYPVTDQASFELFLGNRGYYDTNDLINIVITDFSLVGNRLTCNLTASGTILDISGMQVTEVYGFGNLINLQYLYLSENQIATFNPTIVLPSSLQYLSLEVNQIVNFNPTIALPSSLQYLLLEVNQIVNFNPTIALPATLQGLSLGGNQIATFNPTIALPVSLQNLSLAVNQIVNFNPTIALPSSLQDLSLIGNQIVNFNPTIALPASLQYLSLGSNQIATFNPTIALPVSLQNLSLGSNQIVNFNPTIALPSSLQYLSLGSNQIRTSGYAESEVWANAQSNFNNVCNMYFNGNIDSISGTNLEAILISKNCQINA